MRKQKEVSPPLTRRLFIAFLYDGLNNPVVVVFFFLATLRDPRAPKPKFFVSMFYGLNILLDF